MVTEVKPTWDRRPVCPASEARRSRSDKVLSSDSRGGFPHLKPRAATKDFLSLVFATFAALLSVLCG
jgi:hypothetical protein